MPPSADDFDKYSFKKYVKNIGRAYRKQAMELISACRLFVQAQEQSFQSDIELRSALAAVDNALRCAAEAKGKTSKEADKNLKDATELLGNYEKKHHLKDQEPTGYEKQDKTFLKKMEEAMSKDKSSSTILSKLKETIHSITRDESQEPTRVVEFLICKSPTDENPIVVRQVLGKSSNLQEILWNFSRYKDKNRLTLKENPHFYNLEHLPRSPNEYGSTFKANAIQDFQHVEKVYVLTDKVGRVYLETQARDIRAFGNVWIPSHSMIFKDIHGILEGERHIEGSIDSTPKVWYRKEHPLPPLPTPPVKSNSVVTIPVWKQVIRLTANDRDIDILISTKLPEFEDGWILYPPSSPSSSRPQQPPKRLLHSPQAQPAAQELPTPAPSQAVPARTSRTARGPPRQRASARDPSLAPHAPRELSTRAPLRAVPVHTSAPTFEPPQLHRSERHNTITSPKVQELPTPAPPQAAPARTSPMASKPPLARHSPMAPPALLKPAPPQAVPAHTFPTVPRPLQQHAEGQGHARQTVVSGTKPGNPTRPAPTIPVGKPWTRNLNWFQKFVWDYEASAPLPWVPPAVGVNC